MAGGTGILAARLCTGLRRDGFHRLVSCCDLVAAQLLICGAARAIAIRMSTERRSEARHYALGVGAAVGMHGATFISNVQMLERIILLRPILKNGTIRTAI